MQVNLRSPVRRWLAVTVTIAVAAAYCGLVTSRLLADRLAQSSSESALRRASQLDPGNAEYQHLLGIHQLALQSPREALVPLERATALNPNAARYWMDLAATNQLIGEPQNERAALNQGLAMDPHTPAIAWYAANLLLADGLSDAALKQFRSVLENDPPLTGPAIRTAWEIRPDVDRLLDQVVPPVANIAFLQFLLSVKQTAAAGKVWEKMYSLQQEVRRVDLLDYERYLLNYGEVDQAERVWRQGAKMSDIAAYQPSPENLLVNGDFSLDILNGGFDWVHQPIDGVSVALDTSESHSSARSLRIAIDGAGISDAGISQVVAVEPNTRYELHAIYKAKDLDGAGAMQLAVQEAYRSTPLFASEDLRNADFWKDVGGSFVTSADTRLVRVHIIRVPPGRPIRGKLWIDGLRLTEKGATQ